MQCSGGFSTSSLCELFLFPFQYDSWGSYLAKQGQEKTKKKFISKESELIFRQLAYVSAGQRTLFGSVWSSNGRNTNVFAFLMTSIFLYLQRPTLILILLQPAKKMGYSMYLFNIFLSTYWVSFAYFFPFLFPRNCIKIVLHLTAFNWINLFSSGLSLRLFIICTCTEWLRLVAHLHWLNLFLQGFDMGRWISGHSVC